MGSERKEQITEFEKGHLLSSRWSTFSDGRLRVRCLNREAYGGGAIGVGVGIGVASRRSVSMRTGGSRGLLFFRRYRGCTGLRDAESRA